MFITRYKISESGLEFVEHVPVIRLEWTRVYEQETLCGVFLNKLPPTLGRGIACVRPELSPAFNFFFAIRNF